MPIKHGGMLAKKESIFARLSCLLNTRAVFVNPVDLENLFCQIDADSLNVHDGRSAQVVKIYRLTVAQGIGGDHSINKDISH